MSSSGTTAGSGSTGAGSGGSGSSGTGCGNECEPVVSDLWAGRKFNCARSSEGEIRCWGFTSKGTLLRPEPLDVGDNELPHEVDAMDFGSRTVVELTAAAQAHHACAIFESDEVGCWGFNKYGNLGHGTLEHWGDNVGEDLLASFDDKVLSIPGVSRVLVGARNTCALIEAAGGGHDVLCWGDNSVGQLGLGHTDSIGDDEVPEILPERFVQLGGATVDALAMGENHMCALLTNGAVRCWGSNEFGELGLGRSLGAHLGMAPDDLPDSVAADLLGLEGFDVAEISAGRGMTCVRSTDGRVRCWGVNGNGRLGYRSDDLGMLGYPNCSSTGSGNDCVIDTPPDLDLDLGLPEGVTVESISIGYHMGCALDSEQHVRCWGMTLYGHTGYGDGWDCGVDTMGDPYYQGVGHTCTPAQVYELLDDGGVVDVGDFDEVAGIDPVADLQVGYLHNCVITTGGDARCWGNNEWGQLGYGFDTFDVGETSTPGEFFEFSCESSVPIFSGAGCTI